MSLNFVSTSVLTSEDGIAYSTETAIPSEEAQANRLKQQSSNGKSLYEQLEERKLLKEEEYNNNTKLIFAPPRALDEEDVEFFEDLNENKNRELLMRKEKERRELELFRQAQKKDVSSSANSVEKIGNGNSYASTNTSMYKISVPEKKQDNAPVVNIVRVKRKDYPTEDNKNKRQALDYSKETADNKNAKSDGKANLTCNEAVDKQPLSACGATAGSLSTLSGYGSDSE